MFICCDIAKERYVSIYWEDNMLFVVIKKVHENGELAEDVAIKHNHEEAHSLLLECQQSHVLHGVEVSRLNMLAITGRIAEGLRKPPKKTPRISPELWN